METITNSSPKKLVLLPAQCNTVQVLQLTLMAAKTLLTLGGGISGLSTSFFAQEKLAANVKIHLAEASPRIGGWISTERGENIFESGPHSIRLKTGTNKSLLKLIDKLDLWNQVVPAGKLARKRSIFINGSIRSFDGIRALTFTALWRGLFNDLSQQPPMKPPEDESLYDFFRRRLGRDILPYIDAFASGVYAGNIRALSVKSVFPRLYEYERNYGSIFKGLVRDRQSRYDVVDVEIPKALRNSLRNSISFRSGLDTLTNTIGERLENPPMINARAIELKFVDGNKILVAFSNGQTIEADHLVSALPSYELAKLLRPHSVPLADLLDDIEFTDVAVVNMAWKVRNTNLLRDYGFGYLVPSQENQHILGTILTSNFSDQASSNAPFLMTVMMGGENYKGILEHNNEELVAIAKSSVLRHMPGKSLDTLLESRVHVHRKCIPQYNIGHVKRLVKIESLLQAQFPRIRITGNSFYGVGNEEHNIRGIVAHLLSLRAVVELCPDLAHPLLEALTTFASRFHCLIDTVMYLHESIIELYTSH